MTAGPTATASSCADTATCTQAAAARQVSARLGALEPARASHQGLPLGSSPALLRPEDTRRTRRHASCPLPMEAQAGAPGWSCPPPCLSCTPHRSCSQPPQLIHWLVPSTPVLCPYAHLLIAYSYLSRPDSPPMSTLSPPIYTCFPPILSMLHTNFTLLVPDLLTSVSHMSRSVLHLIILCILYLLCMSHTCPHLSCIYYTYMSHSYPRPTQIYEPHSPSVHTCLCCTPVSHLSHTCCTPALAVTIPVCSCSKTA